MTKYIDNLNEEIKAYFKILSPEFPEWLNDYINTKEMQRIGKIGICCGTDYSGCFDIKYWYSNADHSIGVALIIWNFTHDKKQTLAGLFHDIATPAFKHCIDFMNGDASHQESTEERTRDIILNSKEIMSLLKRDNIGIDEVDDYKKYPIADNNTPKLSSDRFEYTFSSGLIFHRVWDLDKIKRIYSNITIVKNEDRIDELAFKDIDICEEYIDIISKLWPHWIDNNDRTAMQFLADMCKSMINSGYLTIDELYTLSELEVIDRILNCENKYLSLCFKQFQEAKTTYPSEVEVRDKYCTNVKGKKRYIVPLVEHNDQAKRISELSVRAREEINDFLNYKQSSYSYYDFDFKPYNDKEYSRKLK